MSSSKGLDRRDFLRLGAVASLAPLVPTLPAWASRLATSKAGALSVGYVEGSYSLGDLRAAAAAICDLPQIGFAPSVLEELLPLHVVPAPDLPMGDQALANEAIRVGVHGIYPELPRIEQEGILATELTVLFPDERDPSLLHPFYAWRLGLQDGPSPSPPISFTVPLGPVGGLNLRLGIEALPAQVIAEFGLSRRGLMRAGSYQTRFTVDWEANLPRLHRGLYLLGLNPDAFSRGLELPGPGASVPMSLSALVIWVDPIVES